VRQAIERLKEASPGDRRVAVHELVVLGPSALDEARKARDAAPEGDLRTAFERAVRWLVAAKMRPVLEDRAKSGLTYDGQYADLKAEGPEAPAALLDLFDDEETPALVRIAAIHAIADLGDSTVLPRLREIEEDPLLGISLRKEAGTLLAILGDSSRVEKEVRRLQARALRKVPEITKKRMDQDTIQGLLETFQANTDLSNLYYRIRQYRKAIECYERAIPILEGLREVQGGNRALLKELALTYYNEACSLSLAGEIDRSKEALRKAVSLDDTHLKNLEGDGDLKKVREAPGFDQFRKELEKPLEKKSI
jgi:tetratricopeptide (TPR) repeat protein